MILNGLGQSGPRTATFPISSDSITEAVLFGYFRRFRLVGEVRSSIGGRLDALAPFRTSMRASIIQGFAALWSIEPRFVFGIKMKVNNTLTTQHSTQL